MRVTDRTQCTESERLDIKLQVAGLWVIGGEISEVFLLNSNLNFQNSTLQTQHQVGLPRIV